MFAPAPELSRLVKQAAAEAGFGLAGIAGVGEFPELDYFPTWIAEGRGGEMAYLQARDEQGRLKRALLRSVAPWARSVVVCALNYNSGQPYSTQVSDSDRGWISRYAWSRRDYHNVMLKKLKQVEAKLSEQWSAGSGRKGSGQWPDVSGQKTSEPKIRTCAYVDTGPLVERVYAKYAGVGWIGKNTCIINQRLGSWLFLGVILTSLELAPDLPAPDRCGSCTRCIEACPTQALTAPYQLDSNRCISYLTIEKRGAIPEGMRAGMGRHLFGCDICQDVCPWNRKAQANTEPELQPRPELVNPALEWLAEMTASQFAEVFRGSPVRRAKLSGLRRNAVIAMGNSGDAKFAATLKKLSSDPDPVVAEHARWALEKI
ncbi:MAG TPA: tRNA epoxyqueuosine(34) reductase QueG [Terriglobales bacterium]|nr:tRNA epoxyqueuosine(34) reductase QueG [Terriglobales bacterium]